MASDAFFPFPDCVELADKAGITAVIQPGGSIKDQLSIDYCNENGVAMVMTGTRHFCLLYTSPSPRDKRQSRMPSSA